jgi:hypothetical protein
MNLLPMVGKFIFSTTEAEKTIGTRSGRSAKSRKKIKHKYWYSDQVQLGKGTLNSQYIYFK